MARGGRSLGTRNREVGRLEERCWQEDQECEKYSTAKWTGKEQVLKQVLDSSKTSFSSRFSRSFKF